MINIDLINVVGAEGAFHGMRHPYKKTEETDSVINLDDGIFELGENDFRIANALAHSPLKSEGKFLRMIHVQLDICAPLYWWKEMDQYKVGTTTNSESTMHTLDNRDLTINDFSIETLADDERYHFIDYIARINDIRKEVQQGIIGKSHGKNMMIQMLPSSYMQTRTWDADYQTLQAIYADRHNHQLSEWRAFCDFIETLPGSELILPIRLHNSSSKASKTIECASIDILNLDLRITHALKRAKIDTVAKLRTFYNGDTYVKGIGPYSMNCIGVALEKIKAQEEKND